ncbi:MAG: aspartate carbamoyltransferase, partial [Gammaproteobacteria bacterium]
FTLMSQAAIGAFAIVFLGAQADIAPLQWFTGQMLYVPLLAISLGLVGLGLFMSTTHLGKPLRFYRGFNNLRHSPVCREGLGIALFMAFLGLHLLCSLPTNSLFSSLWEAITGTAISEATISALSLPAEICGYLAILSGAAGLYYMNRCYRIPARPFWNHWQVATSFYGNALSLGAVITGLLLLPALLMAGTDLTPGIQLVAALIAVGAGMEGIGLWRHNRDLSAAEHEGAASHYVQCTTFGKSYWLRNGLLASVIAAALTLATLELGATSALAILCGISLSVVATSLIGRALFYVLVIPTTMPGAFFWRNKGFEQHARDIGLANMPQVGVAPLRH